MMYGASGEKQVDGKWHYGCRMGQFKVSSKIAGLPNKCGSWKIGGEVMPFVDFRKMTEEELRASLEKIRAERRGAGSKKRTQSRERRVGSGKERKPKEIIRL